MTTGDAAAVASRSTAPRRASVAASSRVGPCSLQSWLCTWPAVAAWAVAERGGQDAAAWATITSVASTMTRTRPALTTLPFTVVER